MSEQAQNTDLILYRDSNRKSKSLVKVQNISKRLHVSDKCLIRQMNKCLPTIPEQIIYLEIAEDYRLRPVTLKKILKVLLTNSHLKESDFVTRKFNNNMSIAKADAVIRDIEHCLDIIDKDGIDQPIPVGATTAALFVSLYGDYAWSILDQIQDNLEFICNRLGITYTSNGYGSYIKALAKASKAIYNIVVIEIDSGKALPLDLVDLVTKNIVNNDY